MGSRGRRSGSGRWVIAGAALAAGIVGGPAGQVRATPPRYTFTDLGTLGGPESWATAVNDDGTVVGWANIPQTTSALPPGHAFKYANGHMTDLDPGGNWHWSNANAINNAGLIVGSEGPDGNRGFFYSGSTYTLLPSPMSGASGVNGSGQIVGSDNSAENKAYLFSDGQVTTITGFKAMKINDSGEITGFRLGEYIPNIGYSVRAVRYDSGTQTDLGTLGGDDSMSFDINNSGVIVGASTTSGHFNSNTGTVRAFRYEQGQMSDLGMLSGNSAAAAWGINDAGDVVGVNSGGGHPAAVLWQGGDIYKVSDLAVDFQGAYIPYANDINNKGQIVGWAVLYEGVGGAHGFLMTPLPDRPAGAGQSTWATDGSGSWGTITQGYGANWGAGQGSPGLDPGFKATDTATFGSAATSGTATVFLDGASPNLAGIVFDDAAATYRIVAGSGGTITLDHGASPATISVVSGRHEIAASLGGDAIAKTGEGVLLLTGSNSYSSLSVTAGTVIGSTESLRGPIANDAAVIFDQDTDGTYSGSMSGVGTLAKAGSGVLTLSGANGYSGGTTVSAGTLVGTTDSLQGAIVNDAAVRFDQNSAGTFAGILSGAGTLEKAGTGTVSLTGNNSYSGDTILSAGSLELGSANALGNGGTIRFDGGALRFTAANTADPSGRFATAPSQRFRIDTNGQDVVLAADLSSEGGSLTKLGAGVLTLSGSGNLSAGTTLSGGTLELGNAGALGAVGAITFGGGSLRFTSADTTDYSGRFSSVAGQRFAIDTNGQDVSFAASLVSVGGTLVKTGAGTLVLGGASAYSGGTSVVGGTLVANDPLAFGTGAVTVESGATIDVTGQRIANAIVNRGGTVTGVTTLSGDVAGGQTFNDVTLADNATITDGTTIFTAPVSGDVAIQSGAAATFSDVVNAALAVDGDVTFQAPVSAAASLDVASGGSVLFGDGSSYAGAEIVNDGSIVVDTASVVTLGSGITGGGELTIAGGAALLGGPVAVPVSIQSGANATFADTVNAALSVAGGATIAGPAGSATAIDVAATGTLTFADGASYSGWAIVNDGTIVVDTTSTFGLTAGIGGDGGLAMVGTGVFELGGLNTFLGSTSVDLGTMLVNGQLTQSDVSVGADGTLGGSGTIGGDVTVDGTLSPGNSPGLLTVGSLSLTSSSQTFMQITGADRGTEYDAVDVSGATVLGGTLVVDVGNAFDGDTTFEFFHFSGGASGHFAAVTAEGSYGSLSFGRVGDVWSALAGDGSALSFDEAAGTFRIVTVPEPATCALVAMGIAITAGRSAVRRFSRRATPRPR